MKDYFLDNNGIYIKKCSYLDENMQDWQNNYKDNFDAINFWSEMKLNSRLNFSQFILFLSRNLNSWFPFISLQMKYI